MAFRVAMPLVLAAMLMPATVNAHTIWLTPVSGGPDGWHVQFGGHAGAVLRYPAENLKEVSAVDSAGKPVALTRNILPDGVRLKTKGQPSVIIAHYDNGIHTKRSDGPSVPKPLNEVPTGISATKAIKYHKTIVSWTPAVTRALGQPLEVVPLSAAQPVAGRPMKVRVLKDGKPIAGISIARNEEGRDAVTDAQGIASFVPVKGFNRLWAGWRAPVTGDPTHTLVSIEYSLGFDAI